MKILRSPEMRWAIGIGTALYFPPFWGVLFVVAAWKAGAYLELHIDLWRQSRRGPRVLELDGQRFVAWRNADGTVAVSMV